MSVRRRIADVALVLVVTAVTLVIAEGGYRVYLWRGLSAEYAERTKDDPAPTFGFYGYPPPWHFDRELGFSYTDGPTLGGAIVDGAFKLCDPKAVLGNRYGNASEMRGDYASADLKIAFFGSSFTMGDPGWRGDTVTNQLQALLSAQLGKRVSILNYSRDATGILTMADIARARIDTDKPDMILFTFNSTAPAYQRQWRIIKETRPGFYGMYQSLDPTEDAARDRRVLSLIPISSRVTPEWCASMQRAVAAGDRGALTADPLVRDLIAEYNAMRRERGVPAYAINFATLKASFLYNRIVRHNDFYRMKVYEDQTIYGALAIDSFTQDRQFVDAMAYVRASKIPLYLVHIPARVELMSGRQYEFLLHGLAQARGESLMRSFEDAAGTKTLDLAGYYSAELRADPLPFVVSETDSHANERGIKEMAEAFDRLLMDKVFAPGAALSRAH